MKFSIACICLTFVVPTASALAELPSSGYEELKADATDVLKVKITKVEMKKGKGGFQDIVYTAAVLKLDRSKSGRKVGDTIRITSYRLTPGSPPLDGPSPPPLLKTGWKGTAYLNAAKGDGAYRVAAHGQSFAADVKK